MPFVTHRGQRIHYSVEGSGPLVVLLHGLLVDAKSWKNWGFVDALAARYRVACVDSLGHGSSDKPADPPLYAQEQRVGDVVAVIEDLGVDRAHLVGHSMGGWLSVGVAWHYPNRLASLTVGGWDPVRGTASALPADASGPLPFDVMFSWAKATAPSLVAWVTSDAEPGLRACWDALSQLENAEAALLGAGVPVMLWSGRDDPYHGPMWNFAALHSLQFLSTPGDHMGALMHQGAESAKGIRAFIDAASDSQ